MESRLRVAEAAPLTSETRPIRPDGQVFSARVDGAFHLAVYVKIFAATEFSFDHKRPTDMGYLRFHERYLRGKILGETGFYSDTSDSNSGQRYTPGNGAAAIDGPTISPKKESGCLRSVTQREHAKRRAP